MIRHPHCVPIMGMTTEKDAANKLYIPAYHRTLEHAILSGDLGHGQKMVILKDIVSALAWMHCASRVVHRNVKPSSIYLDEHNRAYIGNFNYSQFLPPSGKLQDTDTVRGSPAYMAPELFRMVQYTEKVDVYALGMTIYELFTGKPPFCEFRSLREIYVAVCVEGKKPDLSSIPDPAIRSLVMLCIDHDPAKRPTAENILSDF